jgi:hypothetical protein
MRDIHQVCTGFWVYTDVMGETHQVSAWTTEEARRKIDAAIDRKQVRILREELDRIRGE